MPQCRGEILGPELGLDSELVSHDLMRLSQNASVFTRIVPGEAKGLLLAGNKASPHVSVAIMWENQTPVFDYQQ